MQIGTARIWDARTGIQLAVLSGHKHWVMSADYSPDGTRIITASDIVRIWDADRNGTNLRCAYWHTARGALGSQTLGHVRGLFARWYAYHNRIGHCENLGC